MHAFDVRRGFAVNIQPFTDFPDWSWIQPVFSDHR